MKAIVFSQYGDPSVLRLQEVPKPSPAPGEVLVKVHATAVNDWDWCYVRGEPYVYRLIFGLRRPKHHILGAEVAGVVEAVGSGVAQLKPGDRVYGDLSEAGFGGFAEYVAPSAGALALMPETMTFEQAATLPHAGMLALQGLVDLARLDHGEKVLVNGAGGGVGMLALQIAKQYGATVTGVDSRAKLDTLRDLGFDHVIDYEQHDFTHLNQHYDVILDTKTTRSPFAYARALRAGGRYVTVGGHVPRLLQLVTTAPWLHATTDKRARLLALKPNKNLTYLNDLFEKTTLRSVIDGPYPLEQTAEAVERFGKAEHVGKVVIQVAE